MPYRRHSIKVLVLVLTASICASEAVAMYLLDRFGPFTPLIGGILDIGLLMVLVIPSMMFTVFKPMSARLNQLITSEHLVEADQQIILADSIKRNSLETQLGLATHKIAVGEDQIPHIEFTREIARRFNHIYGREKGFEEKAEAAIKKLGSKRGGLYEELRTRYQESGDDEALESARAMIEEQQGLSLGDRERLLGYLEGGGKMILVEPEYKLTPASKMPGLDGQKMSKSYNNTISMRESPDMVAKKIKTMPTDPARIRLTDVGDPDKCPVWQLHEVYSSDETKAWVQQGCRTAGIGCIACKGPVIESVLEELKPIQERAAQYAEDPMLIKNVVAEGCERARKMARETMREVREVMGLSYS